MTAGVRVTGRLSIVSLLKLAPTVVVSRAEGASPVTTIVSSAAVTSIEASERAVPPRGSVAVRSEGQYGIDAGLIASMPVRTEADGSWSVVEGLEIDPFSRSRIDASVQELREERDAVSDLIPT